MAAAEIDIETAVMSIREDIMQYFKGGCVERLTVSPLLEQDVRGPREFQYQRALSELQQKKSFSLSGVLLFTVQREPDTITFNMNSFNRSEELKAVYRGVRDFLEIYLAPVEVVEEQEDIVYAD